MRYKSVETIERAFQILADGDQTSDLKKLRAVPLEMQFTACAVSKGYGPTYGLTTSNNAEVSHAWCVCITAGGCRKLHASAWGVPRAQVAWTVLKNVRNEGNMYEQFVRTTAIMQHHYTKSVLELACAERSKLCVSARLTQVD